MEDLAVTKLNVSFLNTELDKCKTPEDLLAYLQDSAGNAMYDFLSSRPKGLEIGGGWSSDRGVEVRVGGSWRF